MKTFLLNIPLRLKLKDQELDAKAALCNKSWAVFNDEGVKQLFIFLQDETLLITTNGVVTNSTWKYIPANKSIIITSGSKSVMFHPAFLDDVVFALQQDGNESCLFMIDENNAQEFNPKSLTDLGQYFAQKERLQIETEQRKIDEENKKFEALRMEEERRMEQEAAKKMQLIKEEEAQEEIMRRRRIIRDEFAEEIKRIEQSAEQKRTFIKLASVVSGLVCIICFFVGVAEDNMPLYCISFIVLLLIAALYLCIQVSPEIEVENYIDNKLNDME